MKKLRGSTMVKVLAILLLTAMAACLAGGVFGAVFLDAYNAYQGGTEEYVLDRIGGSKLRDAAGMAAERLRSDPAIRDASPFQFYVWDDFCYAIADKDGKTVVDQLGDETVLWSGACQIEYRIEYLRTEEDEVFYSVRVSAYNAEDVMYGISDVVSVPLYIDRPLIDYVSDYMSAYARRDEALADSEEKAAGNSEKIPAGYEKPPKEEQVYTYTLTGYLVEPLEGGDAIILNLFNGLAPLRYDLLWLAAAALPICVLLFAFLMCAAGHRDGGDAITPNFSDKLPSDLFAAVVGGGAVMAVAVGANLIDLILDGMSDSSLGLTYLVSGLLLVLAGFVLAVWLCMSFATRLKLGTVIKNSICWKLLVFCGRLLRAALRWCRRAAGRVFRAAGTLVRNIPVLSKTILALAVILLAEFICVVATVHNTGVAAFLWLMESAALTAAVLYVALCLRRLQKGIHEIAQGNTDYTVDTRHMYMDFKTSAEDLNSIQAGINRAVNERMKSERFKTELITNVSHDIKTPLTSIINYVDLLGKEEPESEKMREYIDVLSRQSARLKKLIEDLIEASKASSGSLTVNLERFDLGVLVDQTAGEYAERMAAAGLELVVQKPKEPVTVLADGRHTWRIFDNLMNNACKYALPGTRVYLNLEREGKKASVTFRNISHTQLNISGDDLMERFVRGDASRNTEGSGLGLSIAQSLAQLQGSELELTVDGDLFKVTLRFDTAD